VVPEKENPVTAPEEQRPLDPILRASNDPPLDDPQIPGSGSLVKVAVTVFVVGNEGAGIREKTLEACDVALSIPMHARTESLNAAVSAGVVFYEWSRKHPEAL
jgi:tRNA G18 (ribose-2'-O)-methylase SpoU